MMQTHVFVDKLLVETVNKLAHGSEGRQGTSVNPKPWYVVSGPAREKQRDSGGLERILKQVQATVSPRNVTRTSTHPLALSKLN